MEKYGFLTGNTLKITALLCMTCDHVGKQIFPQLEILQIIGRLAFPIFAFFISEGCKYTKNRKRYFRTMLITALLCQVVYFVAFRSLYQCILVTFSLSILLIYAVDNLKKDFKSKALAFVLFVGVYILTNVLPKALNSTDFYIDYGFFGVLFPVAVFVFDKKYLKMIAAFVVLVLLSAQIGGIQWYSLLAIPLLLMYNGRRGKYKLKSMFYIYYPAHLVVIYLISLFLVA